MKTKTTHASEPVDLKASMAPAQSDKTTIEMKLGSYDTVSSKENNTFYVIGGTESGLRVSIRLWKEANQPGTTYLRFRVRIGDLLIDGKPSVAPDKMFDFFPKEYCTGFSVGSGHRSIQGILNVPVAAWDTNNLVAFISQRQLAQTLYKSIVETLKPGIVMTEAQFFDLFMQLAISATAGSYKPPEPTDWGMHWGPEISTIFRIKNGEMHKPAYTPKALTKPATNDTSPTIGEVIAAPSKPAKKTAKSKTSKADLTAAGL